MQELQKSGSVTPPNRLTINVVGMLFQDFLVELFRLVELAKHFVKPRQIVFDRDRNGRIVLKVLLLLHVAPLPSFAEVAASRLVVPEPVRKGELNGRRDS